MNQRHSWVLGLAQWALRGLALLFLLGGAAGVLGASGTKSIYDRHVPRQFAEQVRRLWPQSGEMPTSWVKVRPPHYGDTYAQFNGIPDGGGTAPAASRNCVTWPHRPSGQEENWSSSTPAYFAASSGWWRSPSCHSR